VTAVHPEASRQAVVEAALVLLERMGLTADLATVLLRSRATGQVIHRAWLAPLASRISDFGISSRERPGGRCRPVRSAQHGGKGGAP
jgi:hypothetical protein